MTRTDAAPQTRTDSPGASSAQTPWWREAVIYQVYIRSFADADGDGVGDIAGIRSRLPYLADLGVDALWVNPFYPSPMADHGYDVADYRDIEPVFGRLADADALVREAHDLGLRVVLDLVPNHTSDAHAWFRAALAAAPGSPERARYVFRPGRGPGGAVPPNDWESTFGGPAWTRVPDGEWYLHLFAPEQPDLAWDNPQVREELHDVLRFWLGRGVDGFRIDVAHGLVKDPALPDLGARRQGLLDAGDRVDHPHWDREGVHEIYRGWREVLDAYPDRMLVAEAWVASSERLARYLRPDELHTAFNFSFLKAPWDAGALRAVVEDSVGALAAVGAPTTWVLSNHDTVRHTTRYGGGATGARRARAAALLMLALPGSAYVYQGEELGLPEVEDLPDEAREDPIWKRSGGTRLGRDGARVPLPWTPGGSSYGFGGGGAWLPQPGGWGVYAVAAQEGDPASMLELYRGALRTRRAEPALGDGGMRWLPSPPGTLVFARDAEGGPGVVCAVNTGAAPAALATYGPLLLASAELADPATLPPDTAAWYRLA